MNIIKDLKGTFYQKNDLQNISESSTIHTLLRLIENNTDESKVEDTLFELRELNDRHFRNDVQETINTLSFEQKICPICGEKLKVELVLEKHNELEGSPSEEYMHYICENCNFTDDDN